MTTLTQASAMLSYHQLYHPLDVEEAVIQWQASCGPAALAAVLQCAMATIREAVMAHTPYATKGYMNPLHVKKVLNGLALSYEPLLFGQIPQRAWPSYGLGFVQWEGPWLKAGVPPSAAYRYTHWVGLAMTREYGRMIYDINAWDIRERRGDWVPLQWWNKELVPEITKHVRRASGGWHLRWATDVVLPQKTQEG